MGKHTYVEQRRTSETQKEVLSLEEKRSRVQRKGNEKKSNSVAKKNKGVTTLRFFADLGRVFSFLKDLWTDLNF